MTVDAVDIDPAIIDIAKRYFALKTGNGLTLHTADGFAFIAEGKRKYDIIYMDAFLKPSVDTDPTGTHFAIENTVIYEQIKSRLNPSGVVAFNINPHPTVTQDIATIKEAFGQVWVVPVPARGNTIVFASIRAEPITDQQLKAAASSLDQQQAFSLSYAALSDLSKARCHRLRLVPSTIREWLVPPFSRLSGLHLSTVSCGVCQWG